MFYMQQQKKDIITAERTERFRFAFAVGWPPPPLRVKLRSPAKTDRSSLRPAPCSGRSGRQN